MTEQGFKYNIRSCTLLTVKVMVVVATCCSLLILQGNKCLAKYIRKDTLASLSVRPTAQAPFLGLTIFPDYGIAFNQTILSRYGIERGDYREGRYAQHPKNLSSSHYDLFEEASYKLNEIIKVLK